MMHLHKTGLHTVFDFDNRLSNLEPVEIFLLLLIDEESLGSGLDVRAMRHSQIDLAMRVASYLCAQKGYVLIERDNSFLVLPNLAIDVPEAAFSLLLFLFANSGHRVQF